MAASPRLEDVKDIDQETKHTVTGYIRDIEQQFPADRAYYTFPTLALHLCLLYFYHPEQFDPNRCHSDYKLSHRNTAVSKHHASNNGCVLLSKVVSKGRHCWKFQLTEMDSCSFTISIGVVKANAVMDLSATIRSHSFRSKAYGWVVSGSYLFKGDGDEIRDYTEHDESGCHEGDIIDMILDLDALQLRYYRNGTDLGVAYHSIEQTEYKAAVSMYNDEDVVTLLSYKRLRDHEYPIAKTK
mmetsp:Transcript_527/g.742  ORF Transcript_527/g.742 Transcript_527/m.742 type:complete len:241 (+) Transcript_527:676-1398(+)